METSEVLAVVRALDNACSRDLTVKQRKKANKAVQEIIIKKGMYHNQKPDQKIYDQLLAAQPHMTRNVVFILSHVKDFALLIACVKLATPIRSMSIARNVKRLSRQWPTLTPECMWWLAVIDSDRMADAVARCVLDSPDVPFEGPSGPGSMRDHDESTTSIGSDDEASEDDDESSEEDDDDASEEDDANSEESIDEQGNLLGSTTDTPTVLVQRTTGPLTEQLALAAQPVRQIGYGDVLAISNQKPPPPVSVEKACPSRLAMSVD